MRKGEGGFMKVIKTTRKLLAGLRLTGLLILLWGGIGLAQETTQIVGNHATLVESETPIGLVPSQMPLQMAITVKLRDSAGAQALLADLLDPASPNYHKWLSTEEFAARFDPAQTDVDAVTQWLANQGFTIESASRLQRTIRFSGTAAIVQTSLRTRLHYFGNGGLYGNVEDPTIPAQFAGLIAQIHGLDNLHAVQAASHGDWLRLQRIAAHQAPIADPLPQFAFLMGDASTATDASYSSATPNAKVNGFKAFSPADFQYFFHQTRLANAGNDGGAGDCIAIVGDSDYEQSSIDAFNSAFSLPPSNITPVAVDGGPGGFNGDELETLLDLEWSHAAAPGAALHYYNGNPNAANDIVDQIGQAVTDNVCGVISVSFGLCGGSASFYTGSVSPIYTQAAIQGQSIFISSGDQGSAGIVFDPMFGCVLGTSKNVNELGADPNVTAVGGATFSPSYDRNSNDTSVLFGTKLKVWNDHGSATGGGISAVYTKPTYQNGLNVLASTNMRGVPDVSLIASPYFPGALTYVDSDCINFGFCSGSGTPQVFPFGGTSLSTPTWAGFTELIAHALGSRPGPLNQTLYVLAGGLDGPAIFKDVTSGNNALNHVAGFTAAAGYDLATGWGAVDIAALVNALAGTALPGPQSLAISPATTLAFGNVDYATAGSASVVKTIKIRNSSKFGRASVVSSIVGSAGVTADPACAMTIATGKSLSCKITFSPQQLGAVAGGSLTINDDADDSPQTIALTGTGIQGKLILTPASVSFSNIPVGMTSTPKIVKLENKTGSTFTIASISNPDSRFVVSAGCVGPLAANSTCQASVTYTPTATAKVTDTIMIADDALGSPQQVALSGTGK
jgi:subtilase family serine protease